MKKEIRISLGKSFVSPDFEAFILSLQRQMVDAILEALPWADKEMVLDYASQRPHDGLSAHGGKG